MSDDKDRTLTAILAEYAALRTELMFFIDAQRRIMTLLLTASVGQLAGMLVNADKIDPLLVLIFYLFLMPFLIFIFMLRALENGSKILLIADYIHKGIKPQILSVVGAGTEVFEWEEHKRNSNRINRTLLMMLDVSRWWVFSIAIAFSFSLGCWFQAHRDVLLIPSAVPTFFVSGALSLVWIVFSAIASRAFNEAQGESRFKPI